jgi:hypothetical protein
MVMKRDVPGAFVQGKSVAMDQLVGAFGVRLELDPTACCKSIDPDKFNIFLLQGSSAAKKMTRGDEPMMIAMRSWSMKSGTMIFYDGTNQDAPVLGVLRSQYFCYGRVEAVLSSAQGGRLATVLTDGSCCSCAGPKTTVVGTQDGTRLILKPSMCSSNLRITDDSRQDLGNIKVLNSCGKVTLDVTFPTDMMPHQKMMLITGATRVFLQGNKASCEAEDVEFEM